MGKVFFTSDIHFGHSNIIKYCRRPFASVEEMNEKIVRNWNEKVSREDEVFILGDLSFMSAYATRLLMLRMNGKKYVIVGNHDKKLFKDRELANCFEWIKDYAEIQYRGIPIVLFHYPIAMWNGRFHGAMHLYGHVHNGQDYYAFLKGRMTGDGSYNVGMDVNDFAPVDIEELIEKNRQENV